MTPAGQRWTRSTPTAPGWYWWQGSGIDQAPVMVYVRHDLDIVEHFEVLQSLNHSFTHRNNFLAEQLLSGRWQGPLTPNEATE